MKLNKHQRETLQQWLWHLTGLWNWAVRKIELDAADGVWYSELDFANLTAAHSKRVGLPSHTMHALLCNAWSAWARCFQRIARKPRLKGRRNRLNSIPFPDPIKPPRNNRIRLPLLGEVRFHKQDLPAGRIKCGRLVKRASGWYLCLFIDAAPSPIPHVADGAVGIDPGFRHLLTLSSGEKVEHPRELEAGARRLAQAQRGGNRRLAARIQERQANRRKDRNHKLSRHLVAENQTIAISKDNVRGMARAKFGKSVASSAHGQLRQMLAYKCRAGGRRYVEVSPKNSTRTCSACGALAGPTGLSGLKVRLWDCGACGAHHDRDVNAAVNTLRVGLGASLESGASRV
jgi:putative transposase